MEIILHNYNLTGTFFLIIISSYSLIIFLYIKKSKQFSRLNHLLISNKNHYNNLITTNKLYVQEMHHRVKNNLQLVISLMKLQALHNDFNDVNEFVEKCRSRIFSMILVHQSLYIDNKKDLVDIQDYFEQIILSINNTFENNVKLNVNINANHLKLNTSTVIPLGLILNEILTNIFKHSKQDLKSKKINIDVSLYKDTKTYSMQVKQETNVQINAKNTSKCFGLKMINLLSKQLNGEYFVLNESGFCVQNITFKQRS